MEIFENTSAYYNIHFYFDYPSDVRALCVFFSIWWKQHQLPLLVAILPQHLLTLHQLPLVYSAFWSGPYYFCKLHAKLNSSDSSSYYLSGRLFSNSFCIKFFVGSPPPLLSILLWLTSFIILIQFTWRHLIELFTQITYKFRKKLGNGVDPGKIFAEYYYILKYTVT